MKILEQMRTRGSCALEGQLSIQVLETIELSGTETLGALYLADYRISNTILTQVIFFQEIKINVKFVLIIFLKIK